MKLKKSDYDEIEIELRPKQYLAYKYLNDKVTEEIVFGGGTRGGKSYLGCTWVVDCCLKYPGSRYLIGRKKLKDLKITTFRTLKNVLKDTGLVEGEDYNIDGSLDVITFYDENGEPSSEIILKDLALYPADPEYTRLGSLELTGAFIDECGDVPYTAIEIIRTRLSHMLDEYDLVPKMLMTCNPSKNWLYFYYYKPWKEGKLPKHVQFIQSLVDQLVDGGYVSKRYVRSLERMRDENHKARLLYGDWEHGIGAKTLFEYDVIHDMFTNTFATVGRKYITCDAARFGSDRMVVMVWDGLNVIDVTYDDYTGVDDIVDILRKKSRKFKVARRNIIVDEDGVGGGVIDFFKGIQGFIGNSKPLGEGNYRNLRTECYYKLADCLENDEIGFMFYNHFVKETLSEELEATEKIPYDGISKLEILPKKKIIDKIRRSPDFADALSMRMYYHEIKIENEGDQIEVVEPDYSDNTGIIDDGSDILDMDLEFKLKLLKCIYWNQNYEKRRYS